MLNLRQIEAFRAVYGTGSVTGASRLMNISQPSVTRLISDLEDDIGFRLFARQRRGMTPTPEAELFQQQVERSFLGLKELRTAADEIRGHGRHRLVVGLVPAVALEFAPAIIAEFSQDHSELQIDTRVSTTDRNLDEVRAGRVSLAIVASDADPVDVNTIINRGFPYMAMMRHDHPSARRSGPLDLACPEHEDIDLIAPPPSFLVANCPDPAYAERFIRASKVDVEVHFTAAALARHGMGVALIDPFTAMFFRGDASLTLRPLVGAPSYPFRLVEPRRLHASGLQRELVDRIRTRLDSVTTLMPD